MQLADVVFAVVFTIEVGCRAIGKPRSFFRSPMELADGLVVVAYTAVSILLQASHTPRAARPPPLPLQQLHLHHRLHHPLHHLHPRADRSIDAEELSLIMILRVMRLLRFSRFVNAMGKSETVAAAEAGRAADLRRHGHRWASRSPPPRS